MSDPLDLSDLHGWSLDFAVPAAYALAAGAIKATDGGNGCLEISETDSDRAYESHRAEPPTGLLQSKFRSAQWGVRPDGLDAALRIHGLWDDDKTTLTLLLGHDFAPFERLYYRFNDGTLTTVDTGAFARDWQGVERFEAALRRHLPDAKVFEDDGTPWTAAGSRERLEGRASAQVNLAFDLSGTRLLGALFAKRENAPKIYHLVIMAKPPTT